MKEALVESTKRFVRLKNLVAVKENCDRLIPDYEDITGKYIVKFIHCILALIQVDNLWEMCDIDPCLRILNMGLANCNLPTLLLTTLSQLLTYFVITTRLRG